MEIDLSSVRIKFGGEFSIVFPKDTLSHSVVPNYSVIQEELKCTIKEAGMN